MPLNNGLRSVLKIQHISILAMGNELMKLQTAQQCRRSYIDVR